MRYWFGQSLTDWTMSTGVVADAGGGVKTAPVSTTGPATITFWDAAAGGTRHTDLLDASGSPINVVVSADGLGLLPLGTIPRFQGPDDVTQMWADAGAGVRYLIEATGLGDTIADLKSGAITDLQSEVAGNTAAIGGLQGTVGGLATVATSGEYADLVNPPVLAAVASSGAYSDLADAPAPGLQYVLKVGGSWPARSASAPDTGRPAVWIGAEPAPPAGGGYALDGDAWWPTP